MAKNKAKNNKRKINGYSVELFGPCIWEERYRRWGQLAYTYSSAMFGHSYITSSFYSIVWFENDWHAYRMWPYLCYSGERPIRYRRLSGKQTMGIYAIAVCTSVRHWIYFSVPRILRSAKYAVVKLIGLNSKKEEETNDG